MELGFWMKIVAVVAACIIGLASRFIMKQKPDNYVEQMAEARIKQETGLDIDLSPDVKGEQDANN